jgi:dCTP deaminase
MSIITREKLADLLESKKLIIDPILDIKKQVGELSIDLRLGIDFLITSYTRNPYIDVDFDEKRIDNHFKKTRRQIGDQIILYPHQTVLASTLEYVKLPSNVFCELKTRSSYNRLGLSVSTIIQPGYTGCFSLELTNNNLSAIKLTTGSRVVQAIFHTVDTELDYLHSARKYLCQVRPVVSMADKDEELKKLKTIRHSRRNFQSSEEE